MCGIAGFWVPGGRYSPEELLQTAGSMGQAIRHRGPDSGDNWADGDAGLGFAHRRLAIVDLSPAGAQPMISACGRYVIVYNGEVYNTAEMRSDLEARGIHFRGHSDTEVILEACAAFGVADTVRKLIGMFAFAFWDRRERVLTLARDRMGIKPLFWYHSGREFLFGSEIKALRRHPACPDEICRNSVASFVRYSYVPTPASIFQGMRKLRPGCLLVVHMDAAGKLSEAREDAFWSLEDVARDGLSCPDNPGDQDAIDGLENLLGDAIQRRMVADVPLGALLSGGIDSSLVAALMQSRSSAKIRTFSIGFHEDGYNEATHAAAVAQHLGTDHTELYVTPEEARAVIPGLPDYYDEPFADSSQIPTWLVSRMARDHVTVVLSGDGGDELFGGYTRYFTAARHGGILFGQPRSLRRLEAAALRSLSPKTWDRLRWLVPASRRPAFLGDKLHKLAGVLNGSQVEFYEKLVSHWSPEDELVIGGEEHPSDLWRSEAEKTVPAFTERMMYLDSLTYLPDDILTKVDRASMAVSLEARVPLLDHRVVEMSWRLPRHLKIRNGQGKWLLRQILYRHVPEKLIERPKMGFGVPIDSWLRGPLREWAGDLLSPGSLERFGLINPGPVQEKWEQHQSGSRNWQYHLWDILMLQSWCYRWLGEKAEDKAVRNA